MTDTSPPPSAQPENTTDDTGRSVFGSPTTTVIACQMICGAIVFVFFGTLVGNVGWKPSFTSLLLLQGVLASVAGLFLGLSRWWVPVQILLPVTAAWALKIDVPSWGWLLLFATTLLVFWNSARGGVPLYLSNRTTWRALSELLGDRKDVRFMDLGGGLGGTTLYLARANPEAEFFAVESAPIPFAILWLRSRLSGLKNLHVEYGDFWDLDFSQFNVFYAFLSPVPMPRLYDKVEEELKPGSLLISNSFDVPGHPADEIQELEDKRCTKLHIWRK